MILLVASCDKNEDLFRPFHHCIEKYWPEHPEVIYMTDSIENPYYRTICVNHPLDQWTKRLRETLDQIEDNKILLMVDDCFIRRPVDNIRVKLTCSYLTSYDNTACFNFEKSFDSNDATCEFLGFKKRQHNSDYEVSIMCGLWDKTKLKTVIAEDTTPWAVEFRQNNCGFDYYVLDDAYDYIIDWGYRTGIPTNVFRGKWCKDAVDFFRREGIDVDYSKRGIR